MNRSSHLRALSITMFFLLFESALSGAELPAGEPAFRPPAVPLVVHDPYLSIWSMADRLTDNDTRHWTRREHPLSSLIRIDGKAYRLMGTEPKGTPALPQVGLKVLPTRTIYDFEGDQVHVKLTFLTPALPDDLSVLARPVTYLTWEVSSTDNRERSIAIFFGASARIAADPPGQAVAWQREVSPPVLALRVGTVSQRVLGRAGDDTSIDWGYLYVAAQQEVSRAAVGKRAALLEQFATEGVGAP